MKRYQITVNRLDGIWSIEAFLDGVFIGRAESMSLRTAEQRIIKTVEDHQRKHGYPIAEPEVITTLEK